MYLKRMFSDKMVGAIAPSSSFCVKKVSGKIDYPGKKVFVEYGSGAGEYTKHFLEQMDEDAIIVAFETDKYLFDKLNEIDDPRLKAIHDGAENAPEVLGKLGVGKADYIVSGIPFTFLEEETRNQVLSQTVDLLRDDGAFVVYQFSPYIKVLLKKHFKDIAVDFTPLNLPPMFVMKATGKLEKVSG